MPVISEGSACGCLVHRCCPAVSWSMEEELWQRRQLTCSGGLWKFSCGDHFSERQWLSPGRGGVGRGSTREGSSVLQRVWGRAGHSGPRGRGVGWADSAEERLWILKSR